MPLFTSSKSDAIKQKIEPKKKNEIKREKRRIKPERNPLKKKKEKRKENNKTKRKNQTTGKHSLQGRVCNYSLDTHTHTLTHTLTHTHRHRAMAGKKSAGGGAAVSQNEKIHTHTYTLTHTHTHTHRWFWWWHMWITRWIIDGPERPEGIRILLRPLNQEKKTKNQQQTARTESKWKGKRKKKGLQVFGLERWKNVYFYLKKKNSVRRRS